MNLILREDLSYIYNKLTPSERAKFKGSSILITGCAGFLGFSFMHFFAEYAEKLGIRKVVGLDTFILGKPDWISNIEDRYSKTITVQTFNISTDDVKKIKNIDSVQFVIHGASIASPTFYRKFPLVTLDANIWGLRRLLDFYAGKSIKGFLFFSSSEIYGDPSPENIPTDENYRGNVSCLGPRACYDESKRFGETLCQIFAQQYGMPLTIARPFNNYGPGMRLDDRRVPADFAKCVIENKDINILSSGSPMRTFCYVADAIVGYLKCMIYGKFDYFNIGIENPEISVLDLANIYRQAGIDLNNYNGEVVFSKSSDKDYLTHNPNRRCPIIKKARSLLGYAPEITVEQGVRRFLKFLSYEREEASI